MFTAVNRSGDATGVTVVDGLFTYKALHTPPEEVPYLRGPAARTGDVISILTGPHAGEWRMIAQALGTTRYLLDAPLPDGEYAIAIGRGFVDQAYVDNTIDLRGMIGLPGDFTPPSRFVRATAFSATARETEGGYDTVREAFRILDNFNIPADAAEGAQDDVSSDDLLYSATQITTASDSQNLVYYYHTMYDRTVHMVDMKEIDFLPEWYTSGKRKTAAYRIQYVILGGIFLYYAFRIWIAYTDALARQTFRYSIIYLALLFAMLLLDHYLLVGHT